MLLSIPPGESCRRQLLEKNENIYYFLLIMLELYKSANKIENGLWLMNFKR